MIAMMMSVMQRITGFKMRPILSMSVESELAMFFVIGPLKVLGPIRYH